MNDFYDKFKKSLDDGRREAFIIILVIIIGILFACFGWAFIK
jgi:hypothetical protein